MLSQQAERPLAAGNRRARKQEVGEQYRLIVTKLLRYFRA